jgi:hypothetical protein
VAESRERECNGVQESTGMSQLSVGDSHRESIVEEGL